MCFNTEPEGGTYDQSIKMSTHADYSSSKSRVALLALLKCGWGFISILSPWFTLTNNRFHGLLLSAGLGEKCIFFTLTKLFGVQFTHRSSSRRIDVHIKG